MAAFPLQRNSEAEQRWQNEPQTVRNFLRYLSRHALDMTTVAVFADWLEEQGRHDDLVRYKRLLPREGEVFVVTGPTTWQHYLNGTVELMAPARVLVLPDHTTIRELDPATAQATGLYTEIQVRYLLRRQREECAHAVRTAANRLVGVTAAAAPVSGHLARAAEDADAPPLPRSHRPDPEPDPADNGPDPYRDEPSPPELP
jgi:uncharacterized protein (TIGR02996 family)